MRRALRLTLATALTLGMLGGDIARLSFSPAPAEARWGHGGGGFGYGIGYGYPYGRYGYGHGYYRRNHVSAGEVIATVAVIAGVAAVASAASRADRDRRGGGWDDDRGWDDRDDRRGDRRSDRREDIAVDECRDEAERQARTYGTSASLRDIYDVDSRGNSVRVKGLVEVARSEPVAGGTERRLTTERFTCVVRGGLVESYQLGDGFASRY
jgi:hypothetical protein